MIRNSSITYGAIESPLMTLRPEDPTLHAFLVAVLTTILTYQTTAIVFDLLTGIKPAYKAPVSDLGSTILAQESSLLSAAASIIQSKTLWQWRFKPYNDENMSRTGNEDLRKSAISLPVCFKFLILFSAVPVLNIFAIILSLEKDSFVSFRDVRFGGIALGYSGNQTVDVLNESIECDQYVTAHTPRELTTASFHRCSQKFSLDTSTLTNNTLSIRETNSEDIEITLGTPENRYQSFVRVDVRIVGEVYRLREKISEDQGKQIVEIGLRRILEGCENMSQPMPTPSVTHMGRKWSISQFLPCPPSENVISEAFSSMLSSITVIDTEAFELVKVEDLELGPESTLISTDSGPSFIRGDDLPFLKRRRSFLSFAGLCIAVACAVVLRVMLKSLTNNDINYGIECIVKAGLGKKHFDSGLADSSKITFCGDAF